jgi:hypothetical protein
LLVVGNGVVGVGDAIATTVKLLVAVEECNIERKVSKTKNRRNTRERNGDKV